MHKIKKGGTLQEQAQDKEGGNIKRKATRQGGQHYENMHKIKKGGTLQEQAQDKEGGQH